MYRTRGIVLGAIAALALFACQETEHPLAVEGENPLFAKGGNGKGGGNPPAAMFSVDIVGDVSGSAEGHESISGQIVADLFTLDITAIREALGTTCFPDASETSVLALTQSSQDADVIDVQMVFKAKGDDGTTDVKYGLTMSGSLGGDGWLPTDPAGSTIALDSWTIGHDSGKGKNVACSGAGALAATVTVVPL